eukprot:gnl/Chilomastix_caulleri/2318.p1 GENE.gnl/Chilomastix_caulleri/2318~~gnl/Chilomastix_caulleri/2318.p1  ORF type:complete len:98 (+),score=6.67 gnl/Chilomastix_caulleri/2318:137-430(+)
MDKRTQDAPVDKLFVDRWSPISFKSTKLTDEQIKTLFEASRWAPSCYNDQPWHFVYGTDGPEREAMNKLLMPKNYQWASKAPLLILFRLTKKVIRYF